MRLVIVTSLVLLVCIVPTVVLGRLSPGPGEHLSMFFTGCAVALCINHFKKIGWITRESGRDIMIRRGDIVPSHFTVVRSMQFHAEGVNLGPHFFMELTDGRTLFLEGNYLLWEPRSRWITLPHPDPANLPREFPCSEFTLFRDKCAFNNAEIECSGEVLAVDVVPLPVSVEEWNRWLPEREAILDKPFDRIKSEGP